MNLQNASFIVLLSLVTLAFFGLLAEFLQPVFWAATLAVLFHPIFHRALTLTRDRKSLAALLTLICICITVILPAWFVATAIVSEAAILYTRVNSGEINIGIVLDWSRNNLPLVGDFLEGIGINAEQVKDKLTSAAISGSQMIGSFAFKAGQNAVRFGLMFFLMLYILYYFLRDGDALIDSIIHALPLGDERERALFAKFAEVSRATVKGTLVVGVVQGTLGGLILWLLGVQSAVFWGSLMVVLSLLPVVGAAVVWFPAALFMLANGMILKALILIAFGVLVIGLVDNLLRPILVGRDTRMPDYLVLLSTLGGLTMFGASGIVIGPIIAALFLACWVMFASEIHPDHIQKTGADTDS
jgi:predicted PurR-regulated permease PerM